MLPDLLECVINVSEGRNRQVVDRLAAAAGASLLDLHADPDHHRSVLTLGGPADQVELAARAVAAEAVAVIDLNSHSGAHPRFGAVDVVPFVALAAGRRGERGHRAGGDDAAATSPAGGKGPAELRLADGDAARALAARDRFAGWVADRLALPCFYYGPERSLPEVRRRAWRQLRPDTGPDRPHPTAGACAVGARPLLVAYNLWLGAPATLATAREIAAAIRGPAVRALGLPMTTGVQVSCNLIDPLLASPADVYDAVASRAGVDRAELVGLLPAAVLDATSPGRWGELGLSSSATIEARLQEAGLDGGRFTGDR